MQVSAGLPSADPRYHLLRLPGPQARTPSTPKKLRNVWVSKFTGWQQRQNNYGTTNDRDTPDLASTWWSPYYLLCSGL